MFIWTAKFSRKRAAAAVLFMGLVMIGLIFLMGREPESEPLPQLPGNLQRVAYLRSLGWEVAGTARNGGGALEEPYLSYNELQLQQGFDLSDCCGRQISRYTYAVANHPSRAEGVQANLYLCDDVPVAGDIFCPGADGFQSPLIAVQSS